MKLIFALTIGLLLGLLIKLGAAQNDKGPVVVKPLITMAGADSHVHKPSYQRITTADVWHHVWATHLGTSVDDAYRPTLEVDFDRCLVVAVLCGDEVNVRGLEVHSILDSADSLTIRIERLYYQTAGEANKKVPDRPYVYIVLPKTNKNIILERGIQPLGGTPIKWEQFARLDVAQANKVEPRQEREQDSR